jgi:hypothetical protein
MTSRLLGLTLLLIVMTACSAPPSAPLSQPTPTPFISPIPSLSTPHPPQTANTPPPFTTGTPGILIESPGDLATPTPLPQLIPMPTEKIAIYKPGPGSQVTSPFQVAGWGGPCHLDRVHIRLIGEDGRILSKGKSYLLVLPGNAGRFYSKVPFDIQYVAEAARLEITTYSSRDRQMEHLATVDLILLSTGDPLVHPAIHGPEQLAIFRPRKESIVSGGSVLVQGAGWVNSDTPLTVSVLDRNGEVLGSATAELDAPAIGQLGTFEVEVLYQVSFPQWARIGVSEPSTDGIPGLIHFSSVEVWLKP